MPVSIRPSRRFLVQCSVTYNAGTFLKLLLVYCSGFWLLITLLVLSSGPAHAEWVAVDDTGNLGMTVYVDPDTVRHKGNLVKMWQLWDYKTVQTVGGPSFLSVRSQVNATAQKSAFGRLRIRSSLAIWETVIWFSTNPTKTSGSQLHQRRLVKCCGHLPVGRSDRAVLERLGRIIEMGQRVAKGTAHWSSRGCESAIHSRQELGFALVLVIIISFSDGCISGNNF
jgi:hypothetical protein